MHTYSILCSTARGFECGTALSLVCPTEEGRLKQVEERLSGEEGTVSLFLVHSLLKSSLSLDIGCTEESKSGVVKPYTFKMSEIEGFRYRITVSEPCYLVPRLYEPVFLFISLGKSTLRMPCGL